MPPVPHAVKLAVLDDYLDTGRKHFEPIVKSSNGHLEMTVFQDTLPSFTHPATPAHAKQELIDRLKPFTIISTMRERTPFPPELLNSLPNLKLLLTTGMRNASIDLAAAKGRGVTVAGTEHPKITDSRKSGSYPGSDTTAQHAWALILGITRGIARDDAVVKNGGWQSDLATGLDGKSLALLGLGRIGAAVAKIGKSAFGMNIIAWSSSLTQETADERARDAGLPVEDKDGQKTFEVVSKEELFSNADILSVQYVLSDRSRGIVAAKDLVRMKPSAFLVNTSRGPLVDEDALLGVLQKGGIAGAALDVYNIEPLPKDSPWRTTAWGQNGSSDVILSPHMGYVERNNINGWYAQTAKNVQLFLEGKDLVNRMN
ncbi:MAG: hypothetical protein M4579_002426 [Chaenotheca gracillima]|nr:MAG: hypothetical protein M4579_002426 [Chaenotheca gracillima]